MASSGRGSASRIQMRESPVVRLEIGVGRVVNAIVKRRRRRVSVDRVAATQAHWRRNGSLAKRKRRLVTQIAPHGNQTA